MRARRLRRRLGFRDFIDAADDTPVISGSANTGPAGAGCESASDLAAIG